MDTRYNRYINLLSNFRVHFHPVKKVSSSYTGQALFAWSLAEPSAWTPHDVLMPRLVEFFKLQFVDPHVI